MFFVVNP